MRSLFAKQKRKPLPFPRTDWKEKAGELYHENFVPIEVIVVEALKNRRYGVVKHALERATERFAHLQKKIGAERDSQLVYGDAFVRFFHSIGQKTLLEGDSTTFMLIMENMIQLASSMPTAAFTSCFEMLRKAMRGLMEQATEQFKDRKAELMEIKLKIADAQLSFAQRAGSIPEEIAPAEKRAVSAKEVYLNEAILAYREGLDLYAASAPTKAAAIQNNLGNAYSALSEVREMREKEANLELAIAAYEEALKVRTLADFPVDYAMTQNNLGYAYGILSLVREKEANLKLAIRACEEALKVYTLAAFPVQCATTQNNLGNAYRALSKVRDKESNLELAIAAKESNLKLAIAAYEEALTVRTLAAFPVQYAATQNSLGNAYGNLAEVGDKESNLKLAIAAYQEALKIYTEKDFPDIHNLVKANLEKALASKTRS